MPIFAKPVRGRVVQPDGVKLVAEALEEVAPGQMRVRVRTWGTAYHAPTNLRSWTERDSEGKPLLYPVAAPGASAAPGYFIPEAETASAAPTGPVAPATSRARPAGGVSPADVLSAVGEALSTLGRLEAVQARALAMLEAVTPVLTALSAVIALVPDPDPDDYDAPPDLAAAVKRARVACGGPETLPGRAAQRRAEEAAQASKPPLQATPAPADQPESGGPVVEVQVSPGASQPADKA